MIGESLLALASPWLAGKFTAALLQESPDFDFSYRQILILWLGVFALQSVLRFSNTFLSANTSESILSKMRVRIFDHLQALPLGYYHDRKRGEVLSTFSYDAEIISEFVVSSILSLLPQTLTLAGALYFIYIVDPLFALIFGISVPFFFLMIKIIGRRIRPITRAMFDGYGRTFSIVEENLQLLPIIKSFNRENQELDKFKDENSALFLLTKRYLWIQSMLAPLAYFIAASATLLLLSLGAARLESGNLSIDQLVSLLLYGMLLTRPVSNMAQIYGDLQQARSALDRLVEILSSETEQIDNRQPPLPAVSGDIELIAVDFGYNKNEPILKNFSLKIKAGETVAITGRNGAGKSTLAYLLQRFAEPQKGVITIDGIDISTVSLSSLRNQISVVSQQVLLLNGSIRENILFGRADADQQSIEAAATAARATPFIKQLPNGLETHIGDQGVKLSGGQKQRLALARALLKDAPILILDEATAMFDPEGEESFISECHQLLKQCTVLLITHRPASLDLADRVMILNSGQISERV